MGLVIENPYDPLRTLPTSDEQVRRVTFGDWGMATYVVSDGLEIVRIIHLTWAGQRRHARSTGTSSDSSGDCNDSNHRLPRTHADRP
jgi:hypothetical protein